MDAALNPKGPRHWVELLLRIGLGGLFIYAGAAKLPDLEQFFWDVHHFGLTPWDLSMGLAMFLPWLEIMAGGALIVRRLYTGALLILGLLSAVFLAAIVSAWARGLDITCGCFGKEENATDYAQHIALNGGMLGACLLLGWIRTSKPSKMRSTSGAGASELNGDKRS